MLSYPCVLFRRCSYVDTPTFLVYQIFCALHPIGATARINVGVALDCHIRFNVNVTSACGSNLSQRPMNGDEIDYPHPEALLATRSTDNKM